MSYKVKKAAVLGSGVMGSGIACHLANVGIDVLMLDIQPNDKSIKNRNIIADESLKNAIKSRPNPLYKKEYASRITTGNFDDDFEKIKDAENYYGTLSLKELDLIKAEKAGFYTTNNILNFFPAEFKGTFKWEKENKISDINIEDVKIEI